MAAFLRSACSRPAIRRRDSEEERRGRAGVIGAHFVETATVCAAFGRACKYYPDCARFSRGSLLIHDIAGQFSLTVGRLSRRRRQNLFHPVGPLTEKDRAAISDGVNNTYQE
jgi:hypothetical protein